MARVPTEIKSLARTHTYAAIRTLAFINKSPTAPASARVAAATALLDRGWGKADQAHVGADGGAITITIRQLVESINGNADGKLIEHQPATDAIDPAWLTQSDEG
jgi:hypothetical protein